MKRNVLWLIAIALVFSAGVVFAQEKLWVSSDKAKLKAESSASSMTVATLPMGTEVTVFAKDGRWYKISSVTGEDGWIYRGRLSDSPPAEEVQKESEDLFAFMPGSSIQADEADTARSIRGLSPETEQYAKSKGTPAEYKAVLDKVLALSIDERELDAFLSKGKIGEYAR
ncbi:SH3 domain-containing protein [Thermodesulfobacteriota bacterium]